MKLLSFQPFSLFRNGGGSRVLRRLYEGHESQITSLVVQEELVAPPKAGNIAEVFVAAQPTPKRWMRWYLRTWATWLRENTFRPLTVRQIRKQAAAIPYDAIHVVNHSAFSAALCDDTFCANKPLWVSFHDHFTTTSTSSEATGALWNRADRRLVISPELGEEYQRLFGTKDYDIITDGVSEEEISVPHDTIPSVATIYFAGLLHIEYLPLFEVLADALDQLSKQGFAFKLILRGTQKVKFLNNRAFETEYRTDFISDKEIKEELDSATILYLPIKFSIPNFYLYSLSTKMISYLGGSGSILYHGPGDSAACKLLQKTESAVCCTSLDAQELAAAITKLLTEKTAASHNAKVLARNEFNLRNIQQRFWQASVN